jgi:hypothetical protein
MVTFDKTTDTLTINLLKGIFTPIYTSMSELNT